MSHHVTLYTKPGCHLCELTSKLVEGLHRDFDFSLEEVDITRDPKLLVQYGERIPALVVDDRTTICAPIRLVHVRAALAGRLNGG
jgi:glutaredoxin